MKRTRTFSKFWLLLPALLVAAGLGAQVSVSGRVTDQADGSGLIGATVKEKGTTNGIATDLDGNFTFSVSSAEAVLIISYTGYATKEVPLNGRSRVDIVMGEDITVLQETVVVGYGTQKKSDLTGAVGTLKTKDIERIPTASIEQALQGKIAGVYVTPTSGEPGAGATIRIRGTGTLNNANPLYVIDGMIAYDASFINPQDIQSVEVLKDASAAAIYGSRGSNGVILITTKNGKNRENAVISLNSYYGTQQITKKIDLMNAAEFAAAYNELVGQQYFPDPAALGEGTDWQDEIFRSAPIANVQLAANGGSERFSYNISGNYFNQSGILRNSEFERVTLRFNNELKLNKWLTLGNNLAYSNSKKQIAPTVAIGGAYRVSPTVPVRDSTGAFADPTSPFGLAVANPVADLYYKSDNHEKANRFFGSIYGDIKLLKYFTFRSNFGFDLNNTQYKVYSPVFRVSNSQLNIDDRLSTGFGREQRWIWEQTLTFNREWEKHRLNVLAGYTAEEWQLESIGAARTNFTGTSDASINLVDQESDPTQTGNGGTRQEAIVSYLFRTNYVLLDRYLLTASVRVDQSSRFTENNRKATFPSFSVGWNLGQESFIENLGVFDRLKLRYSYGILGNQNSIKDRYYPSLGVIRSGLYAIFGTGEELNDGATLVDYSNPNLKWETSRQSDIGLEFGVLNGRLSGEIDYYNRLTYDIIAAVPIPDYVGSGADPLVNTAQVRNKGWDITLNWRQNGRFSWNIGAILSPVKNEIVRLNDLRAEIFDAFQQGEPATHSVAGLPIGSFYGFKVAGVFQTAEEVANAPRLGNEGVGDLRYADLNGDSKIDENDRTNLGSPIPTLTYGFSAGFDVAGFDFAADVLGVSGNKVYNAKKAFRFSVYNWEASYIDHWTPANPNNTTPRITNGGHNYRVSDFFLEDGSFLRLRSVVLGYTLPRRWMQRAKINKLRIYVSGFNLLTSQKYSGYSPEFSNSDSPFAVGIDNGGYPLTKSYQTGLELTF